MPKSEYASFDFYNYRSAALEAVNGFSVGFSAPRPAESGAAGSLDETPRISTEAMSLLIAALYESAMDPQHWKVFLELLRSCANGNYASLVVRDPHGENVGWVISATGGRSEVIPYDPYAQWSPFLGIAKDQVLTLRDVMTESEWHSCRYYTDWCKGVDIEHILAVDVMTDNGCSYGWRITRPASAGAFESRQLDLVRMLVPHLKRVLNMQLNLHRDRQVISLYGRATAQLMMGVVILDQAGKMIEANPAATTILNLGDGIRVNNGALEAVYANDNRKLQRLIRDALLSPRLERASTTEGMSITRQSGQLNWGVVVQSISADEWTEGKQRPSVAVFLRDTTGKAEPPVKLTQQLFHLTPAETAVATHLSNGMSLEEAAEALGIKPNTARAHLRSIFSKTGVRRQTELVRLFLNSVAWLGNQ
ncbi:helix-turn-helix transcriptional regulator [Comamonas testosteroni]|jgi:DNA-binding CsgD family transcriptional regulator/PAS domain-containing protein|uniref:Transcriptional regulator, LuxR family n=1 Tax=Comamonas testosteroni (strain DSM 14576 / KF-1) TaxID=399795 RepID=B7WYY7_COMTK|nr:helix-turn-helix transcriptional regulator [Comamonas testosteroni]EED68098.1 transcriptional regulator, LuxR family [Comamonas testosteroni KF-1]WQG66209.1 helix-turn-helix transcriptional regulator [Comamonas testosteroni]